MIRFLINTTIAERDRSGNCYNYSIVTSTKTGATIEINSGWGSDGGNIKAILHKAGLNWNEMHYSECIIQKREFKRRKSLIPSFFREHEVTAEMLFELEKEESA